MENEILALPYECWRWYDGFEGIAQVSTRGRVQTVDRWVTYKDGRKRFYGGQILKQRRDKDGYLEVKLTRDGKGHYFKVHRMVLEVWGDGNPENKPQVNHLDENKCNNDVYNLEWATASENINFGTANKRRSDRLLNNSHSKPVQAIDPNTGQVVREFPSASEAGRNGFSESAISNCCQGKKWYRTHKGFVWKYKDDYDQENTWTPVKIGRESIAASLSKPVQALDPKTGIVVLEFASGIEAEQNGFQHANISACCRGKRRFHKGLIWRYKD